MKEFLEYDSVILINFIIILFFYSLLFSGCLNIVIINSLFISLFIS